MKRLLGFTTSLLLLGPALPPAQAAFSSIFIFGDGVCSTTDGPGGPYYGNRYCNGRVWVEVLAQRLGLGNNSTTNANWYYSTNNVSYYGHYSSDLVTNVNRFNPPPDATNALFVVWCADADFVWDVELSGYGTNRALWANAINQSLTNHFKAITNLYHAKGARTVILPNAVDITKVPHFANATDKSFYRDRTIEFNAAFTTTLMNQIRASCPGITIYVPDFFSLLDDVVAHPANYGLIKPETFVWADLPPAQWALDGPGTNYVFWDDLNPTAKAHVWLADLAHQLIAPARISRLTALAGSNRLDVANIPIGRDGFVDGSTNFLGWTFRQNITSTNVTQAIFVTPAAVPMQFYRLRFPFTWSWP